MTIHFDITSAETMIRLWEDLRGKRKSSPLQWRSLYGTGGIKSLLESGIRRRKDIKTYLETGNGGAGRRDFPVMSDVSRLFERSEEAAGALAPRIEKWLPGELVSEEALICYALYGGVSEYSDPPVLDAAYALTLEAGELEGAILRLALTQLIKRYQDLEKYYLKNFLPIRRHMDFIYGLWEIQIEGVSSLVEESGGDEGEESLVPVRELLSAAAKADRRDLDKLGKRFREEVDFPAAGRYLYSLFQGDAGLVARSLGKPTSPWLILRREEGLSIGPEENFFLDQLDSLLT